MVQNSKPTWIIGLTVLMALSASTAKLGAQETSVNPGINKSFENPKVATYIERFEQEGRDVFDHRQAVVRACNLKPGMTVADIGAGTGLFTRLFSPLVGPSGTVYAVDIADNFVEHIEATTRDAGLTNVVGVSCSQDSTRLPPNSIDVAFICDTYHHFEFPQKTMQSIHRALKPDGQLILIDFHRIEGVSPQWAMEHVRAGQEVFTKEIESTGFTLLEDKKDILEHSYFLRFHRTPTKGSM